jgi:hypothetical protein
MISISPFLTEKDRPAFTMTREAATESFVIVVTNRREKLPANIYENFSSAA